MEPTNSRKNNTGDKITNIEHNETKERDETHEQYNQSNETKNEKANAVNDSQNTPDDAKNSNNDGGNSTKYKEESTDQRQIDKRKQSISRVLKITDELEDDETEITAQITVQTESAWRWLVVCASFMNLFFLDGVSFTFGSILPDMVIDLQLSDTPVAFINSLSVAIYFMASPLASAFINRFGFRECCMTGSFICSMSLFVTYFLSKYGYLCIFYGVFAGFGYAMINMSSGLVVGFYFEKFRALAMAVTTCGSSVGVATFYPVNSYLVNLAGWRSTILLHSGLIGIIFFSAMIFRPLISFTVTKEQDKVSKTVISQSKDEKKFFGGLTNNRFPTAENVVENGEQPQPGPSVRKTSKLTLTSNHPPGGISHRHLQQVKDIASSHQKRTNTSLNINVGEHRVDKRNWFARLCFWEPHVPYSRPMYRDDAFYEGSLNKLPQYRKSVLEISEKDRTGLEYHLAVTRAVTVSDLKERQGFCSIAAKRVITTMMDPSLLKRPSFLLLCSSGLMTYLGFLVPYVFLSDRNMKAGIDPKHCSLFVSTIGLSNIFGRLVLAGLASKIDPMKLFIFSATTAGLSTMMSVLNYSVYYQYFYCVVFGFTIATSCLRGVILVSLYGLEKLTNTMGVVMLFLGLGNLVSTPVASLLKNRYGYDVAFCVSGFFIMCSGLIVIPVKAAANRESRKVMVKEDVER